MSASILESTSDSVSSQSTMLKMVESYWISQCIYVAAKLGIADLLKEDEKHYEELATLTETHSDSLYRLLRTLASVGIFSETQAHYFQLNSLGACLQSNVPYSTKSYSIMLGEEFYQAWGKVLHSVRTGESAFEHCYDMDLFKYYQRNPLAGGIFDQAMRDFSAEEKDAVLATYNFSSINNLVDVAGGDGSLLTSILQENPTMTGVVFDLPDVIERAKNLLESSGVLDRCKLVSGDFFKAIPTGGDIYMLKHIIHDWDWERALLILKHCHQAMTRKSKLLVIEKIIAPENEPCPAKLMDMHMLVVCSGGRERTEAQYCKLFKSAGFKITQVIPTRSDVSIIEGVRDD